VKRQRTFLLLLLTIIPFSAMAIPHCSKEMDKSDTISTFKALHRMRENWIVATDNHFRNLSESCFNNSACFESERPKAHAQATAQIGYGKDELQYEIEMCERIFKNKYKMSNDEIQKLTPIF
jgi:hypothetical protein